VVQLATYRKVELVVLSNIPHAAVDDNAFRSEELRPCGHETTPASGGQALWLLYVHDASRLVVVHKVLLRRRRRLVASLDHLYRQGWSDNARLWLR
jgi:hypothetical protein